MNKGLKLVPNILQYLLCNSSKFHCLEHPRKGVIEKMVDLVEFWLILERDLVENVTQVEYLISGSENYTQHTKDCNLSNEFCLTEFGSSMKKL
jgi:hypothetical protein